MNIRLRKSTNPLNDDIECFVWVEKDGMVYPAKKLEVDWDSQVNPLLVGSSVSDVFSASKEEAQQMFEDLWEAGYRPSKGRDVTGDLKAKDAHIAFAERTVEGLLQCLSSPR